MAWWDDAACAGQADLFDLIDAPIKDVGRLTHMVAVKRGRLVCKACPVAKQCAQDCDRLERRCLKIKNAASYLYSLRAGETPIERIRRRTYKHTWNPETLFAPLTPADIAHIFQAAGVPRVAARTLADQLPRFARDAACETGYPLGPRLMEADRDFVVWVIEKVAAHYDRARKTKNKKKKKKKKEESA